MFMLNFEPFSISSLQKVLPYVKKNPSLCSNLSAGYLFMWNEGIDVRFCVHNDTFVVRQTLGEQTAFSYPIGSDINGMIDELKEYALQNRLPLRFFAVDEKILDAIRSDTCLQPAMWTYDRRWSDYIYSFDEIMSFKGRKFNGQRNHINKFKKLYGEPDVRFLTPADKIKVQELLNEYETEHSDSHNLELVELQRTKELLDVYDTLGLYAAGLFVQGKLAAFSIGEVVGDMLLIHVEKALTKYNGVYPTMFSNFVRLICDRLGYPLKYVNREDDSGDPGLATSKMQYHPIGMENKYIVHVNSPATKMDKTFSFSVADIVLTEIRESDKTAYLKLNTDIDNNRYWGYDYREDLSISQPVDENTFYNSVMLDMRAGDSINFAVRLSKDGEMIGEVVLWNFTSDGTAELGCRIFAEYQGNGYGKTAFGAVADFATRVLNVKVVARCFRENMPSYRMIVANDFILQDKDEKCYYFKQVSTPKTGFIPKATPLHAVK